MNFFGKKMSGSTFGTLAGGALGGGGGAIAGGFTGGVLDYFNRPSYEEWAKQFGPRPEIPDLSTPSSVKDVEQFAKQGGDSTYATVARAKLGQQMLDQGGVLQGQVAGNQAGGYSKLMQRGGLTSGARERLAASGEQSGANALANLQSGGLSAGTDISLADAKAKQAALMELPKYGYMDQLNKLKLLELQNKRYQDDMTARLLYEASNKPGGVFGAITSIPETLFG